MKRICILLLTVLLLLVGCSKADKASVTVESILEVFDSTSYYTQDYSRDVIDEIQNRLTLENDINRIIHIVDQNTAPPNLEWVYVYEFVGEKDAVDFEENRTQYVKTVENGKCVRYGKIVVYGNSELINSISG